MSSSSCANQIRWQWKRDEEEDKTTTYGTDDQADTFAAYDHTSDSEQSSGEPAPNPASTDSDSDPDDHSIHTDAAAANIDSEEACGADCEQDEVIVNVDNSGWWTDEDEEDGYDDSEAVCPPLKHEEENNLDFSVVGKRRKGHKTRQQAPPPVTLSEYLSSDGLEPLDIGALESQLIAQIQREH